MSKETRWLLTFAGIFLVIGVIATLLISSYVGYSKEQKKLAEYKDLFPAIASIKEDSDFEATDIVIKKENIYDKNENVIGKLYTGKIVVENTIPNVPVAELSLMVAVGSNSKVIGITTIESGHTEEFYEVYNDYFKTINEELIEYKIDSIAGSSVSGGIINEILKAIEVVELGIVIPDLTPYEELFGEGSKGTVVIDYIDDLIVREKAEVYDEEENLIGYTYTGTVTSDVHDEYGKDKELKVMVGVDLEGKVVGLVHIINEHTASFYSKYEEALNALNGVLVEDLKVDVVTGSTRSANVLNQIFNAIKEVIEVE